MSAVRAFTCAICGSRAAAATIDAPEMLLCHGERFRYQLCGACGCLQLREPPADPSRYYPSHYYSFASGPANGRPFPRAAEWLLRTGTRPDHAILDVGCGSGQLLRQLRADGYGRLVGIDPFAPAEVDEEGLTIRRATLEETRGAFHLVMLHHVLEHLPDQLGALRRARSLLEPGGYLLVRVPLADSAAFARYRESWVQIDAPRHHFLHSHRSLEHVARAAGLALVRVRHDSTAFQFLGSERYRRGIPLHAEGRHNSRFRSLLARAQAAWLNRTGRGDQAAFYFVAAG